jgi:hypothetical protein
VRFKPIILIERPDERDERVGGWVVAGRTTLGLRSNLLVTGDERDKGTLVGVALTLGVTVMGRHSLSSYRIRREHRAD